MSHERQEPLSFEHRQKLWDRGYVHVYTGDGKGKTTAALGLALRAAGSGLKTYIGQFMKGGGDYGELKAVRALERHIHIEQYGGPSCIHWQEKPPLEEVARAQAGLDRARQAMLSGDYDIVVLDEINVAVHFRLLSIDDLMGLIEIKPSKVELICTGRKAPKELIERADLVSDIREVKHYYRQGIGARTGIEK